MHILIVNTHHSKGGASRAARRLELALQSFGVKVDYLSYHEDHPNILNNLEFKYRASMDRIPALLVAREKIMFSAGWLSNSRFLDKINKSSCDVVHLHWVNSGSLSISDIGKIKKPIVWSLHDIWAFTGGCHYDNYCQKYIVGCGSCPILKSNNPKDISFQNNIKKKAIFESIKNITIVGLSKWISEEAKKSYIFKNKKIMNLPNPIDTDFFFPEDKSQARACFGLPVGKKLILFGAMSAVDDSRKGYRQLIEALRFIPEPHDIELVVFGSSKTGVFVENGYTVNHVGYINSDLTLRSLYSAADVMIVPSLQENLSNAIMESMSCSTPVVAFDIGGNKDMIDHKYNGYLASPFNPECLAAGIYWILTSVKYNQLCSNARKKIISNFDNDVVALQYKNLYESSLLKAVDRS